MKFADKLIIGTVVLFAAFIGSILFIQQQSIQIDFLDTRVQKLKDLNFENIGKLNSCEIDLEAAKKRESFVTLESLCKNGALKQRPVLINGEITEGTVCIKENEK